MVEQEAVARIELVKALVESPASTLLRGGPYTGKTKTLKTLYTQGRSQQEGRMWVLVTREQEGWQCNGAQLTWQTLFDASELNANQNEGCSEKAFENGLSSSNKSLIILFDDLDKALKLTDTDRDIGAIARYLLGLRMSSPKWQQKLVIIATATPTPGDDRFLLPGAKPLYALTKNEAQAFAKAKLPDAKGIRLEQIWIEAGGHPALIDDLTEWGSDGSGDAKDWGAAWKKQKIKANGNKWLPAIHAYLKQLAESSSLKNVWENLAALSKVTQNEPFQVGGPLLEYLRMACIVNRCQQGGGYYIASALLREQIGKWADEATKANVAAGGASGNIFQKLLEGLTPADVRTLFLAIFLCALLEFVTILLVNLYDAPKGWQVVPAVIAFLFVVVTAFKPKPEG